MIYEIYSQEPRPEKICTGRFSMSSDGLAHALDERGQTVVAELSRARLEFAGADGLMVSGFEEAGRDKTGKPKFRYQEWWLRYAIDSHENR
jgi:hypothetical protein